MKKLAFLIIAALLPFMAIAQPAGVESIFDKYNNKEGFTTVNLNDPSQLFGSGKSESEKLDLKEIAKEVKEIRILTYESKNKEISPDGKAFTEALKKINDFTGYQDFLTVNSDDDYVKMVYKKSGDKVSEFLIIVAGNDNESTLIWINGSIDFNNLDKIGNMMDIQKGK